MKVSTLCVFISGLAIDAEIGVYDHEHGRTQRLLIDVTATLAATGVTSLGETLDYDVVAREARRLAADGHVELLETFVERLAAKCLCHPNVMRVAIRIAKPSAVPDAEAAGVELIAFNLGLGPHSEMQADRAIVAPATAELGA